MPKRPESMSGNIEYLQLLFYFSGIILTFYILTQAEDLKDLNDKENVAFRKELAPLLEPLEPKDVRDKRNMKITFNGKIALSNFYSLTPGTWLPLLFFVLRHLGVPFGAFERLRFIY